MLTHCITGVAAAVWDFRTINSWWSLIQGVVSPRQPSSSWGTGGNPWEVGWAISKAQLIEFVSSRQTLECLVSPRLDPWSGVQEEKIPWSRIACTAHCTDCTEIRASLIEGYATIPYHHQMGWCYTTISHRDQKSEQYINKSYHNILVYFSQNIAILTFSVGFYIPIICYNYFLEYAF